MSQFSTMTTSERKMQAAAICREVQAQEGSCIISSSLPRFLILLTSQFLSLSLVSSLLCFCFHLTSSPSPHILLLPTPLHSLFITHINGFNTITYSTHFILRHINSTVNTSPPFSTRTRHCHIHFIGGMKPPFTSAAVANPPFYDPDYK